MSLPALGIDQKNFKSLPPRIPSMSPLRNANPRIYCNHAQYFFFKCQALSLTKNKTKQNKKKNEEEEETVTFQELCFK